MGCVITERPGQARDLARAAALGGAERIVALGGDGTVSEVAACVAVTDAALAIIPAGTGNDFSRQRGIPRDPRGALHLALHQKKRIVRCSVSRIVASQTLRLTCGDCGTGEKTLAASACGGKSLLRGSTDHTQA